MKKYILTSVVVFSIIVYSNANERIDSLINNLKLLKTDTNKINTLFQIGEALTFVKPDSAIYYYSEAVTIADKIGNKNKKGEATRQIGWCQLVKGEYSQSDSSLKIALEIANKELQSNKKNVAAKSLKGTVYGDLGALYYSKSEMAQALEYFFEALKINEAVQSKKNVAVNLGNIGIVFRELGENDKAKEYYYKALQVNKELDRKSGMSTNMGNIGALYIKEENYDSAIEILKEALELDREIGNKKGIARHISNIAIAYSGQNKYENALEYSLKSLEIEQEIGNKNGMIHDYNNIGAHYTKLGKYEKAENYLQEALDLSEKIGEKTIRKDIYGHFTDLYKAKNQYRKALLNYEKHILYRDSIKSEENEKALIQKEMEYEYEKQQAIKDAEHEAQMEIHAAEKKRQKTITYSVSSGLALVVLFSFFLYNRFRVTRKQKRIIEEKEKQTQLQNIEISKQKELVEEKNTEILDSITYAKRLQDAILPPTKLVNSYLTESFILYKPKDIVAGDFYFMDVVEEGDKRLIYYVAADCTGHGVPGAMVSIVGANGLKRCIQEFGLRDPGKILDKLSELVAENFAQSEEKIRDGMDLALCCLEVKNGNTQKLHFAGANNPLWIINPQREKAPEAATPFRQEGGYEIKADKQAIGYTENIKPFTTHTLNVEKGDTLYTFSDGFPDQFGGEKAKKFKSANFKKLLLSIYNKPMDEQKAVINQTFEDWKGELEQIDDVCVIGVRV